MAFLLIGYYGVLLGVAAQTYALSELVHGVDVVYPVSVNGAEQFVALNLVIVHLTARFVGDVFYLLFVSLDDFLGYLFYGVLIVPLFKHFAGDFELALFGVDLLLQRGVQSFLVPLFGHGIGVDRFAHYLFDVVGNKL